MACFDRISTGTSLTLYAMPEWWLGLILIAGLGVGFWFVPGIFPTGGLHSLDVNPNSLHGILDTTWHLTLPVVTLTLAYLADFSLIMRSSLLDELGEDYLQTARAKGLRDVRVRNRHAVRNALLPTTTVIALNIGFVVSGAITVETVFSIPGLGLLSTNAIGFPDFPVLQGTLPGGQRGCHRREPRGQPHLRPARPAGAHMSQPLTSKATAPRLSTRQLSRQRRIASYRAELARVLRASQRPAGPGDPDRSSSWWPWPHRCWPAPPPVSTSPGPTGRCSEGRPRTTSSAPTRTADRC